MPAASQLRPSTSLALDRRGHRCRPSPEKFTGLPHDVLDADDEDLADTKSARISKTPFRDAGNEICPEHETLATSVRDATVPIAFDWGKRGGGQPGETRARATARPPCAPEPKARLPVCAETHLR